MRHSVQKCSLEMGHDFLTVVSSDRNKCVPPYRELTADFVKWMWPYRRSSGVDMPVVIDMVVRE